MKKLIYILVVVPLCTILYHFKPDLLEMMSNANISAFINNLISIT